MRQAHLQRHLGTLACSQSWKVELLDFDAILIGFLC